MFTSGYKENRLKRSLLTTVGVLCSGAFLVLLLASCGEITNPIPQAESGSLLTTVNTTITGDAGADVSNGIFEMQLLEMDPNPILVDTLLVWTPASWAAGTPETILADLRDDVSFQADTSEAYLDVDASVFRFPPGQYTTTSGRFAGIALPGDYSVRLTVPAECEIGGEREQIVPVTIPTFDTAEVTFEVDCVASDAVDASVSGVEATGPHAADGADAATVTIRLRDADGNPVGGLRDGNFTIDVTGDAEAESVDEDIQGRTARIYTVDVTNETAETVTVTVTVDYDGDGTDDVTLDDTVDITFN